MKKLLIFTIWQVGDEIDLTPESNLWYVRRYENYFDEICHIYLLGNLTERVVQNGRSKYVSLGTGNSKLDFLLAPYRLYAFAKRYKPYAYLAVEQIWLFWVVWMAKLILGAKIFLLPITYPEAMYKLTGRSLSGRLPICLEKKLISLSYRSADKAITSENLGSYAEWISSNPILGRKLLIVKSIPEAIPTKIFFEALEKAKEYKSERPSEDRTRLIYVGRLHYEKSVDDLVRMMDVLKRRHVDVHLKLIGDGPHRQILKNLSADLCVSDKIDFLGWKNNNDLPTYLINSDIFVSPSTGGSLREAALCGVPVVAYELDWIKGLLEDKKTFLAANPNDWADLAAKVESLVNDEEMRTRLAIEIKSLGWSLWSDAGLNDYIREVFDPAITIKRKK